MIQWPRRMNWTFVAMVVGPLLIVFSLVALRSKLWGPALEELRVLVKQHDQVLKEQNDRQFEILRRQHQLMEEIKRKRDQSR